MAKKFEILGHFWPWAHFHHAEAAMSHFPSSKWPTRSQKMYGYGGLRCNGPEILGGVNTSEPPDITVTGVAALVSVMHSSWLVIYRAHVVDCTSNVPCIFFRQLGANVLA